MKVSNDVGPTLYRVSDQDLRNSSHDKDRMANTVPELVYGRTARGSRVNTITLSTPTTYLVCLHVIINLLTATVDGH